MSHIGLGLDSQQGSPHSKNLLTFTSGREQIDYPVHWESGICECCIAIKSNIFALRILQRIYYCTLHGNTRLNPHKAS
uniref:Uncharacterized protein n=1 Tax=Anguilla anguilla TaxID=7936 RepID=A0A0E9SNU6_ANGAN